MGVVAGIPYILQSSSAPVPFAIGVFWESVIYTMTLALILGFPSGRFGRAERVILAVAGTAVARGLSRVGAPRSGDRHAVLDRHLPPGVPGERAPARVRAGAGGRRRSASGGASILLVGLATIVLLVRRLVTGSPPRRRSLMIGTPVALAFLLSQLAFQTARLLELDADTFYRVAQWTIVATRSLVWYGFLFALIAAELYAGRVLRGVVTASLKRPGPTELEAMLREPLGDPSLRLGFRSGDEWVDGEGAVLEPPARGRMLTEIERDGMPAAAIVHDAELAEEPELLRAAGAIALLAQENARLEAGWTFSLRALRESRDRIVAASETERRKLERDLHDGAQQRLVALRIRLALAREQATDAALNQRLGGLEADLDGAIEELRDLAHGIFPSLLADQGLLAALRAVARRAPHPVAVSGRGLARYPPEIESAVYYCCLEALQNATKHAGADARIAARLSAVNGELRLEVSDDGPGFDLAVVHGGAGLHNMEDRLGAVHGRLTIVTSPGNGTVVSGVVPVKGR